jgi:hypothetical protein
MPHSDKLSDRLKQVGTIGQWQRRPEVLAAPAIPLPMHGMAPRIVLGQDWWDRERKAAFHRTCQHCVACGAGRKEPGRCQVLSGHECYAIDWERGRMTYVETVPLCERCHSFVHPGYLEVRLVKGEISAEEYAAIMVHGWSLLLAAKVVRIPHRGQAAAWSRWRLVIDGKLYPPLYATRADWLAAHGEAG